MVEPGARGQQAMRVRSRDRRHMHPRCSVGCEANESPDSVRRPPAVHPSRLNKLTASGAGGTLLTASGAGGTLRVDRQRGWRHVPTDPGQGERGRGHTGTRVCGLGTGHTVKRF